jgi:stress response protein SCP2
LSKKPNTVVNAFDKVAENVSSNVLLQVLTHFNYRNENKGKRFFMPKGNVAKIKVMDDKRDSIDDELCLKVVDICSSALKSQYKLKGKLGKVYIDESLKNYLVPFSQRSANKALRAVVRGSVGKMNSGNVIRLFCWWKNVTNNDGSESYYNHGRVDIDLSCVAYDVNWKNLGDISWRNLTDHDMKMFHSGDITDAPHGACEFIDIDIESALKNGVRYLMPAIFCFTAQKFSQIPEVFCGAMMRKDVNDGEIFEAKTVQERMDIGGDSSGNVPFIFDLQEKKIIYADLALGDKRHMWGNTVESNKDTLANNGLAITSIKKMNLYDLFTLHAESRGKIVKDIDKADTVFSMDKGITPFDIDKIAGEYV